MDAARRVRDEWLALRCQTLEPGAFESLFADMEQPLFYYLFQLVRDQDQALELLQETWIRALKTFNKLKQPSSVRAWLYTLAHGIAVDHIRRSQVRQRAEEQYVDGLDTNVSPDLSPFTATAIHDALARLSPTHREALVLHFLEEFSISEISTIIGCPPGTVKSRIHHAKAEIKQILSKGGYGTN